MKAIVLLLISVSISGCSDIYDDIEAAFKLKELPTKSTQLETKTFSVSSQKRKGIETYRKIATVLISETGIILDAGTPFTNRVFIPTKEVIGCSMTCFGTDDQHVDLLIPETGTGITVTLYHLHYLLISLLSDPGQASQSHCSRYCRPCHTMG